MSLVTMIIDGPRNQGQNVTDAIKTEFMTTGITTTDGSAIASLALHEVGFRRRWSGTRRTTTRRQMWARSAGERKATRPTTIEECIANDTNGGPFIKNLPGRMEPGLTTAIVPIPVLFIRAATGDEGMLKTITDAVMKVADAMMIIEGLTSTSTRPKAGTRCFVHMGLPGMTCGAALTSVQGGQAVAELRIIGPARSFEALIASSILPHRVIAFIKLRRVPGTLTFTAPSPFLAVCAASDYKTRVFVIAILPNW